jgi:hypothetical protein
VTAIPVALKLWARTIRTGKVRIFIAARNSPVLEEDENIA